MRFATTLIVLVAALVVVTPCVARDEARSHEAAADRPLLDCSGAIAISCREWYQGSIVGAPSVVADYCSGEYTDAAGEVVYALTLPGPDYWIVTVNLDPEGLCFLDAFLLGSCDEDDPARAEKCP